VTEKDIVLRMKPDRRRTNRAASDSEMARRAYDHYLARDGAHGHDLDDWLLTERELHSAKAALGPEKRSQKLS
jgi:Protein of unknown function (DUF2934)